jgi:hypothetical protein
MDPSEIDRLREIHRLRVSPYLAPGGIWLRLCSQEKLLSERALVEPTQCDLDATVDAMRTRRELAQGETVWLYFYDGDSGDCIGTCISKP